jgi:hypothetical protein
MLSAENRDRNLNKPPFKRFLAQRIEKNTTASIANMVKALLLLQRLAILLIG